MAQVSIKKESDLLKYDYFECGIYVANLEGEVFITVFEPETESLRVVSLRDGLMISFSESHAYTILEPKTKLEIIV